MVITNWKFKTAEGLVLDEHMTYPDSIKLMARDMDMPDNALSYAKVTIYNEDLHGIVFHMDDAEIAIPEDQILGFNVLVRCVSDGLSSGFDSGETLYVLDGKEYPLKKKSVKGVELKILQRLQKLK